MKISYNWLKSLINTDAAPEKAAELLTGCGLEVESIEDFSSVKGGLDGIVIGEVLTCEKHPDADRLSITIVNIGSSAPLNIVCGAPNVAKGQKVVVATVGTKLYPSEGEPFEIKKSKIRGQVSEGMICAEDEIGLGASHEGIMVLDPHAIPGTPAADYFKIENDHVFEIGLTPNRADAASHLGVARDLSAVLLQVEKTETLVSIPHGINIPDESASAFSVTVSNPEACARYSAIVIENVTVKESPDWLKNRLKAIGLRPINNIVDVTNFVLHELGQPLHAFDSDKITGKKVIVRKAAAGEKFVTLDEVERKLDFNDLMICDEEKPMCIAGVFGGLNSGVSENTKSIFLESAYFDSVHIRKTSKRHGLKTDASFRFERGTDPNGTIPALRRAAQLILEVAGGSIAPGLIDIYPKPVENFHVGFSYRNCDTLIGKHIDHNTVKNIITSLGIEILSEGSDGLHLSIPPYKVDVKREADIIEEVLRIYGYNNIEDPAFLRASIPSFPKPDREKIRNTISEYLADSGFSEIVCNSLTRSSYQEIEGFGRREAVRILNPLSSDLDVLRSESVFSGLEAIVYNQNRKSSDLKLFESGKLYFRKDEKYHEEEYISLFITGRKEQESWNSKNENVTFFTLKSYFENAITAAGVHQFNTEKSEEPGLMSCMKYSSGKSPIGFIGEISPEVLKKLDAEGPVFFAHIDFSTLVSSVSVSFRMKEIPKFPAVRRDLALLLDKQITFSQVEDLARKTEKNLLRDISIFDIYEGEKLQAGKKSYAVSFILQDENATLTEKQIDKVMEKLMKTYSDQLGAEIRGK